MRTFGLLAVLVLAASLTLPAQVVTRRDGNWWLEQSRLTKTSYIVGFYDGIELGDEFSLWQSKDSDYLAKNLKSFDYYEEKYLKGVTNEQLADGLDIFFKDYRNRKISIHSAVWLTLNAIAGTPQADLDKMVENFRKNADSE
jgi:hypothetical protein